MVDRETVIATLLICFVMIIGIGYYAKFPPTDNSYRIYEAEVIEVQQYIDHRGNEVIKVTFQVLHEEEYYTYTNTLRLPLQQLYEVGGTYSIELAPSMLRKEG